MEFCRQKISPATLVLKVEGGENWRPCSLVESQQLSADTAADELQPEHFHPRKASLRFHSSRAMIAFSSGFAEIVSRGFVSY